MRIAHDNRPIGVFDSGLGGLTVVAALRAALPRESILYLGDTARVPYGDKSPDIIRRFAIEDADFLLGREIKLLVVACNTVSSLAMNELRAHCPIPVIGVVEAGAAAVLAAATESVTVLGTRATTASEAYRREIHRRNPAIRVAGIACPLFVPIVEEGLTDHPMCTLAMDLYLAPLRETAPDAILLGCTHYPLLAPALRAWLPATTAIIDSAEACASFVCAYLAEHRLAADPRSVGGERFFVTDLPAVFSKQARRFLGRDLEHVEKIRLG
jgi:glutamate racemase